MAKKKNTGEQKRKEIKEQIIRYIQQHGYAPTVREIGELVGIKSSGSVHYHLRQMFENGELETDAGAQSPRAIRVPGYKFVKMD